MAAMHGVRMAGAGCVFVPDAARRALCYAPESKKFGGPVNIVVTGS